MTTDAPSHASPSPPHRRWFRIRFSLRTLLILTTLCGMGTAYGVKVWKRYRAIVETSGLQFEVGPFEKSGWRYHPLTRAVFDDDVKFVAISPENDADFDRIANLGSITQLCVTLLDDMVITKRHVAAITRHNGPKSLLFVYGPAEESALHELKNARSLETLGIAGDSISENDVRLITQLPKLSKLIIGDDLSAEAIVALEELPKKIDVHLTAKVKSQNQFEAIVNSTRIRSLEIKGVSKCESTRLDEAAINQSITSLRIRGTSLTSVPLSRFREIESIWLTEAPLGYAELDRLAQSNIRKISFISIEPIHDELLAFDWTRLSDRDLLIFMREGFSEVVLTHILSQCRPVKLRIDDRSLTFEEFLRLRERFPFVDQYYIPRDWRERLQLQSPPPEPSP